MQIFKSLAACLGEIVSTMLRAIISSAISHNIELVNLLGGKLLGSCQRFGSPR